MSRDRVQTSNCNQDNQPKNTVIVAFMHFTDTSHMCTGRDNCEGSLFLLFAVGDWGFIHKHTCPQPDQRTPRDQVTRGSVDCPNPSVGSWPRLPSRLPSVQELVHPKDPVPGNCRKGVVYSIPCAECYIGQTGRSLEHHLREHRRAL